MVSNKVIEENSTKFLKLNGLNCQGKISPQYYNCPPNQKWVGQDGVLKKRRSSSAFNIIVFDTFKYPWHYNSVSFSAKDT